MKNGTNVEQSGNIVAINGKNVAENGRYVATTEKL